ncbi:MAG: TatD family deoxyribonuclease [candidate division NC10 bacterium]|nr:TatD family deoxyribonuclease [candidate division NC10 bacterium]
MMMIDAHAHMADQAFAGDLETVLEAAAEVGVGGIMTVSENLQDAQRVLGLAEKFPLLKPCAGLYPETLDVELAEAMVAFIRAHRDRLVGIGEVGLDHWVVKEATGWQIQEQMLAKFIALSQECDLPLNVHSRSAGRHTIRFLREHGARKVLMHAFDGKASSALEGIDAGYYFSIPPSVIRSQQKQKLLRHLPLDRLLLESDSPVLGPDPAARNEPKNILVSCQAIASAKGMSIEEVARVTTESATRLFPKAFASSS